MYLFPVRVNPALHRGPRPCSHGNGIPLLLTPFLISFPTEQNQHCAPGFLCVCVCAWDIQVRLVCVHWAWTRRHTNERTHPHTYTLVALHSLGLILAIRGPRFTHTFPEKFSISVDFTRGARGCLFRCKVMRTTEKPFYVACTKPIEHFLCLFPKL